MTTTNTTRLYPLTATDITVLQNALAGPLICMTITGGPTVAPTAHAARALALPVTEDETALETIAHGMWTAGNASHCGATDCRYTNGEEDADADCQCAGCWEALTTMARAGYQALQENYR